MQPQPVTKPRPSLTQTALQIASSFVGTREVPPGSNRGPVVDAFIRSVGLDPVGHSYPWCAAFIYYCFQQAATALGVANPVIRTAGALDHWNRAAKPLLPRRITAIAARKNPELVKPGVIGILLIDPKTGAGHEYLVEHCDPVTGNLTTLDGNSNDGGGREGIGVFRLTRRSLHDKSLVGFLDYTQPQSSIV